jgi:hypothetical protein
MGVSPEQSVEIISLKWVGVKYTRNTVNWTPSDGASEGKGGEMAVQWV